MNALLLLTNHLTEYKPEPQGYNSIKHKQKNF